MSTCTVCFQDKPASEFKAVHKSEHARRCLPCDERWGPSGRVPGRIYDAQLLLTKMRVCGWDDDRHFIPGPKPLTVEALAARLGISGTTLQKRVERGITARLADEMACKVGMHPSAVWQDWE